MVKFRSGSRKRAELRFEVIPIIDVLFTLLIFFVIYSTMLAPVNNKGIQLKLPTAESSASQKKGLMVAIDRDENVYVENELTPIGLLKIKVTQRMAQSPDTYVILSSDRAVSYDQVMQVLDNIRLGGCASIVLEAVQKTTPHE